MPRPWLMTGASSGFGRLLTERLLARVERLVATLRASDALDDRKAQAGDSLRIAALDMTDTDAIRRVVDRAVADLGRLDVVVSNAGYGLFGAAEEVGDDQIRHQIDTNLIGSIQLIRVALPHLRAQGGGRILQVSSERGQVAYPCFSLYHATKWGIEGFVEAVAREVAPFGIALTLVEPGPTRTAFGAKRVSAPAMAAYRNTPAGTMRRAVEGGGAEGVAAFAYDEPGWMVEAMIAAAGKTPAPMRLTLGAGSYERIAAALEARRAALEAQKDIALGG